jgi:rod shape-determining protein MreD
MKQRIILALLLLVAWVVQMVFLKGLPWAPDLLLLMVVFAGIFREFPEAVAAGLVVGALKGFIQTVPVVVNLLLFPVAGMISAMFSKMFFRGNPVIHFIATACAYVFILWGQTSYMKGVHGSYISTGTILSYMWPNIAITSLLAPVLFYLVRGLSAVED